MPKNLPKKNDEFVSINEASRILNVSEKTLRRWEEKHILFPLRTLGKHRRYSLSQIYTFKRKKGKKRIRYSFDKFEKSSQAEILFRKPLIGPSIEEKTMEVIPAIYKSLPKVQKKAIVLASLLFLTLSLALIGQKRFLAKLIPSSESSSVFPLVKKDKENEAFKSLKRFSESQKEEVLAASTFQNISFNVNVDSVFKENTTIEGILAVDSGKIVSSASTFNLVNETATTLNIGGAATSLNLAAGTGTTTIGNTLNLAGNRLISEGDLLVDPGGGGVSVGTGTAGSIDLTGNDLYITGDLEVDGSAYIPTLVIGSDTITDITGTGLQVSSGSLQTTLGTSIESGEIADDTIKEIDLSVSNSPTNAYLLSYNSSTGGFTWTTDSWTDSGTTVYLTDTTDELVLGGTSTLSSAKFSIDGDTDQIQLFIQGNSTQTSNLAVFENSGGTDLITIGNTGILTISDGGFLDLSNIVHDDSSPQGLKLPQSGSLTNLSSGMGYLAFDTSDQRVKVYNGTTWSDISGASTSLQEAYSNDVNGSDTIIALDSSDDSLIFRNPASGGTDSSYVLTLDQLATGATDALRISNAGTGTLITTDAAGSGTTADAILIRQTSSGTITDAIDVSDETITNALNVGANTITGTTYTLSGTSAVIDFSNFDLATTGHITVQGGYGIDTSAAGTLALGDTTATTINLGSTVTTTLNIGAGGALTRAINIGTGTGADTINIGTGGTGADVIAIGGGVGTLDINTGDWDISTSGDLSGIGAITADGAINFNPATTGDINFTVTSGDTSYLNISGLTSGSGSALCLDGSNNLVTCTVGLGGISGSGTAGQIAYFDTTTSITSETSGFTWDATNNKLGIGIDSPTSKFHLTGAVVGKALSIFDETGDQNILTASASGTTQFNLTRTGTIETGDLTLGLDDASATLSTQDTNEDLTFDPNGTGAIILTATTGVNITSTGLVSDLDGNLVLDDQIDIGSTTTGVRVTTTGSISDIDGTLQLNDTVDVTGTISDSDSNLILDDTVDIGSTTTGLRVDTAGSVIDIDGNIILNDTVDLGSATTGVRIATTGVIIDIDGDLVLDDQLNLGSATTGLLLTTDATISDIDDTAVSIDDDISFVGAQAILTTTGDLTLNPGDEVILGDTDTLIIGGHAGDVAYNVISDSGGSATYASTDDDLYIEDILEVGGSFYIGGNPLSSSSLWANTLNVYHPYGPYAGVADLAIGGTATSSAKFHVNATTGAITADSIVLGNNTTDITTTADENLTLVAYGTGIIELNDSVTSYGSLIFNAVANDITTASGEDLTLYGTGGGVINLNDSITAGGTLTLSSVATDITTGTDEDLTLIANGLGTVIVNDGLLVTGTISDSDSNLILDDTVDIGSTTTGLRVDTAGSVIDIDATAVSFDDDISFTGAQAILTTTGDLSLTPAGNLVINTTGGTVDIDDATISLATQATDLDIIDNSTTALTISESTNNYLTVNTDNTNTAVTLDLPVAGATSTTGNLFTSNVTKTINLGSGTAADSINIGTGGTTADTITFGNTGVATTFTFNSGATTTNPMTLDFNTLTTGTGVDLSLDGITTGTGLLIDDATAAGLSSGTLLQVQSVTTDTTAITDGLLGYFDWSPGSSTTKTGDLFRINIGSSGNVTNLLNITDNSSTLFRVAETQIESAVPHAFTSAGDVTVAYDLIFSNQTASQIESYGPLSLVAGESFESNNLTLKTYGTGDIVFDNDGSTTSILTDEGRLGLGTASPIGMLHVDTSNTATFGKAAVIINHDESQDLLTASASGTTRFYVTTAGVTWTGLSNTTSSTAVCSSLANSTDPTSGTPYELRDCDVAPAVDYAESYPTANDVDYADIVATSDEIVETRMDDGYGNLLGEEYKRYVSKLVKSSNQYQANIIGIVSKNYGDFTSTGYRTVEPKDHPMPVALSGRVPVKIVQSSDPIHSGDFLTTSDQPGRAMKATQSGRIIGTALEAWTTDSGKEQIMVFVNNTYHIANNSLSPTGDIKLAQDPENQGFYQLKDKEGNLIDKLSGFTSFVSENVKAGFAEITDLVATSVVTTSVKTAEISPLIRSDLIIDLENGGTGDSGFGKLLVKGKDDKVVAEIDSQGNSTFAGELTTDKLITSEVVSDKLEVRSGASIAGELRAEKIYANEIVGLDAKFANAATNSLTGITREEIENLLKDVETDQQLLSQTSTWEFDTSTGSAALNELALENLYVTNKAAINSLSVTQSIVVGSDLVINITSEVIAGTSIDTLNAPLSIQSSASQPLYIMAGLVQIDTQGNLQIAGDLAVGGSITSSGLVLQAENTSEVSGNFTSEVESGFGKLLSLINAQGEEVAQISASGSARFASVEIGKITLSNDPEATSSATFEGVVYETSASAGSAKLSSGSIQVIIKNPKVTPNSLIFITPTSETSQTIFVKEQKEGEFVVGLSQVESFDISFNWWIIQLAKQAGI